MVTEYHKRHGVGYFYRWFFFFFNGNSGGPMQTDPGPALQHLFRKWYLVQKLEIKLQIKF